MILRHSLRLHLILAIIFLNLPAAYSQQANQGDEVTNVVDWVTGQRDAIPEWVFQAMQSGRYVGISDPCIKPEYAETQAILRGAFLCSASRQIDINILNETYEQRVTTYSTDISTARFTQFVRFSNNPTKRLHLRKGREFTSIYGEYFIELIECDISQQDIEVYGVSAIGEYVSYGSEDRVVRGNIRSELNISASINGEVHSTRFILNGGRESLTLSRDIDGKTIPNSERGRFWYSSTPDIVDKTDLQNRYTLEDGVWCGLYNSMIYSLVNNPNYAYTVKTVNQDEDGSSNKTLIRSIYKSSNVSTTLLAAEINDDSLIASWH